MHWTRLEPAAVVSRLCAGFDPGKHGNADEARRALGELTAGLFTGRFVAIQDRRGEVFIGTHEEAVDHVMRAPACG